MAPSARGRASRNAVDGAPAATLADAALELKLGVISDEIYEQLIYGSAKASVKGGEKK